MELSEGTLSLGTGWILSARLLQVQSPAILAVWQGRCFSNASASSPSSPRPPARRRPARAGWCSSPGRPASASRAWSGRCAGCCRPNGRLLVGHCDDLGTPRTLGPFRDLVGQVGAELTRALAEGGERDAVLAALPAELDWAGHPTVLVVEDVHWADEATLDVLGYLARRIAEPAGRPGADLPRRRADPRASPPAAARAGVGLGPGPPAAVAAPVGGRGPTVERDQPGRRRPGVRHDVGEPVLCGRGARRRGWRPGPVHGRRCGAGPGAPPRPGHPGCAGAAGRGPVRGGAVAGRRAGGGRAGRAGGGRGARPAGACRRPRWGSGTSSPAGRGGLGAGGAPGGAEPAGAPGAGRARGRRPVAHRPPRGSGRRRGRDRPLWAGGRPGRGRRRRPP